MFWKKRASLVPPPPAEPQPERRFTDGLRTPATVIARGIRLTGELQGNVSARRRAELRGTAHVEAEVHAEGVAIAEGCFFDGRIHMQGSRGSVQQSFQEKRVPRLPEE